MLWEVTGADRKTGKDVTITIAAETQKDAFADPKVKAILVSEVKRRPLSAPLTLGPAKVPNDVAARWAMLTNVMAVILGAVSVLLFFETAFFLLAAKHAETDADRTLSLTVACGSFVTATVIASWSVFTRFVVAVLLGLRTASA